MWCDADGNHFQSCHTSRTQRDNRRDSAWNDEGNRRDDGRMDGVGKRSADTAAVVGLVAIGSDSDGDNRWRYGRDRKGFSSLQGSFCRGIAAAGYNFVLEYGQ